MSRINFIKPLPPSREKELRLWYRIMLALLLTIVPAITIISSVQLYLWVTLYRTKTTLAQQLTNFNTILAQQKIDRTQQKELKKQETCLQRYISDPKNPAHILTIITDACKESLLQSITLSKKTVEIQMNAPSTDTVLATIKRLGEALIDNEPALQNVTLTTLASSGSQIHATIKAIPTHALHDSKYDRAAKS